MLPALPCCDEVSNVAPGLTVRSPAALKVMSPPLPALLAVDSVAREPTEISLPAATEIVPPLRPLWPPAASLPLILALPPATIWIEPLRTTMPEAERRPLLLTVAANLAA